MIFKNTLSISHKSLKYTFLNHVFEGKVQWQSYNDKYKAFPGRDWKSPRAGFLPQSTPRAWFPGVWPGRSHSNWLPLPQDRPLV